MRNFVLPSFVRTSRQRAAVALSVIVIAGASALVCGKAHEVHAQRMIDEAPLTLSFTPGTRLHYGVAWSGVQKGRLFAGATDSNETHATTTVDMALAMDFVVESTDVDEATLRLSFSSVDRHTLKTLSSEVFPTQEQAVASLVGRQARLRIGYDGVPRDVAFEPGASDIFVNVVQWVVAQSRVSLEKGTAWEKTERGPFGESRVRYARTGGGLTRTRTEYLSFDAFARSPDTRVTRLDGRSSVRVQGGVVESLETKESVRVEARTGGVDLDANVSFELRLRGVDHGASTSVDPIAFGSATPAGQPAIGSETQAQLLEQRIGGMTREQLLSEVVTMGNGGLMPQHTRWLWRATGWLKKDPTLARELTKAALAKSATDKMRALVLDLFASVGHAEAQAEMRTILTSAALTPSGARPVLLQRVSFLDAPEPATVSMVWDAFREGKRQGESDLMTASAHSLASASRKMAKNGDGAGAHRVVEALRAEVEGATTSASRAELLGALANSDDPEVANVARPFASSSESDLREAAATALRKTDTRDATNLLLTLCGDADSNVQRAALASLGERSLTAVDWGTLQGLTASGRIGAAFDGSLLNLAMGYLGHVPAVTQIVAAIGARAEASAATRARVGVMLSNVPG